MVDIWYEDQRSKVNGMDCYFSDCDCVYRGNLYADRRLVGDYEARDSEVVESIAKNFGIDFRWKS